jgi:hypothetical protein
MKAQFGSPSKPRPALAGIFVLAGLLPLSAAFAQTGAPAPAPTSPQATVQPPSKQAAEDWHKSMARTPVPRSGCFTANYPSTEWREVPCTTAPLRPYPPARGPRPQTVGNGTDWTAEDTATPLISAATGSFDNVTGVTNESGQVGGAGGQVANTFSLQLNAQFFTNPPACAGAAVPANCLGWQQFIYSNAGNLFMQFWLINFNTNCPAGFATFNPAPGVTDCFRNSAQITAVPAQTIATLANIILSGTAVNGGNDTVTLSVGNPPQVFAAAAPDNIVNLSQFWQRAEFNIVGDCCGSQANFNNGSTLVVRTALNEGSKLKPTCEQQGFTGETNNLTLVGTPAMVPPVTLPSIVFTESNAPGGTPSSCAASDGDTHLTTVAGLHYDFQASGDFLLAETGPGFVVHSRQVSGAPNWPNASVNKAVAALMGSTTVALCAAPTRLVVNGTLRNLGDGQTLSAPGGVKVSRSGSVYLIKHKNGDTVRAQLNHVAQPANDWIDVSVGLGDGSQVPKVRGLLGNPNGNVDELGLRDGTVLKVPVSFEDLYHRYADSWRISPVHALLCKERKIQTGIPGKPFYASDLNREQYERARAICAKAGIKEPSAIDDCTLDVTVLGSEVASKVFVRAPVPIAVMQVGSRR